MSYDRFPQRLLQFLDLDADFFELCRIVGLQGGFAVFFERADVHFDLTLVDAFHFMVGMHLDAKCEA